jgi:hypothetical protein
LRGDLRIGSSLPIRIEERIEVDERGGGSRLSGEGVNHKESSDRAEMARPDEPNLERAVF